jgi:predicted aspartyl protease
MNGNQPLVRGSINGQPMLALADTGAFSSLIMRRAAERYGLTVRPLRGVVISGVGGSREAQATVIKELKLGDQARRDVQMPMGGFNRPSASDFAMIIGQDVLARKDAEFDLSGNMIRLVQPVGCTPEDGLAYWGGAYAEARIEPVTKEAPHVFTTVQVNGKSMRAMIDTGAWTTVITPRGAARAGVRGGEEAGRVGGMGRGTVAASVATFDTLTIGDQTVSKPKLRIVDVFRSNRAPTTGSRLGSDAANNDPDMIIGADFFRAHRVLIAYSQRRMYFSHNGRPIFQVEGPPLGVEEGPSAEGGQP